MKGDQFEEFHYREWQIDGIEMNRFAARWYDTIQQFLTAALQRFRKTNPNAIGTNFDDPDSRAWLSLSD